MAAPAEHSRVTATWGFSIANRSLVTQAFLTPHADSTRFTRRMSDYNEIALEITNRSDLNALYAAAHKRVLRAWRNGINRFNGEFVEVRETANAWEFVAKDPYYNMHWREQRFKEKYTSIDAADLAWDLIDLQNGFHDSHLRQGTGDATFNVGRKVKRGERVSEKIEYLTQLQSGWYFTIDGSDDGDPEWAKFVPHYPMGELQDGARFEFGVGTFENCYDYLRENIPLITKVNLTGNTVGVRSSSESISGANQYGLWEDSRGQVLTDDEDELFAIGDDMVMDQPLYKVTMMAGPTAPQLYTDFDVGQSVPILIRRLGKNYYQERMVLEATVLLDIASGAEELESITFLDPGEDDV